MKMKNKWLEAEGVHSRISKAPDNEFTKLLWYAATFSLEVEPRSLGWQVTNTKPAFRRVLTRIQETYVGLTAVLNWSKL